MHAQRWVLGKCSKAKKECMHFCVRGQKHAQRIFLQKKLVIPTGKYLQIWLCIKIFHYCVTFWIDTLRKNGRVSGRVELSQNKIYPQRANTNNEILRKKIYHRFVGRKVAKVKFVALTALFSIKYSHYHYRQRRNERFLYGEQIEVGQALNEYWACFN